MRKLTAFIFTTLNGFYKGENEDISWHRYGEEESKYSEKMLEQNNTLLFGRKTYENMVAFWPAPMAKEYFPKVAKRMNSAEKLVFSNSLEKANWENTKVISGDIVSEVKSLKHLKGNDLTILGSGTIIDLFTNHQLIDEYQIMIDPVAIQKGTSIFTKINETVSLKLNHLETFSSGVVLLYYSPVFKRD